MICFTVKSVNFYSIVRETCSSHSLAVSLQKNRIYSHLAPCPVVYHYSKLLYTFSRYGLLIALSDVTHWSLHMHSAARALKV